MTISRRTAELALVAIDIAMDAVVKRSRRNGGAVISADLERALVELHAAAADVPRTRHDLASTPVPAGTSLLSVGEAATRSGVSARTIERRAVAGTIPATRVGNRWLIHETNGEVPVATSKAETPEEPTRYRVTAEFVNVKTGGMAGFHPGLRGAYTVVGVYRDGLVPADAPAEDLERLLRKNMIERVAS